MILRNGKRVRDGLSNERGEHTHDELSDGRGRRVHDGKDKKRLKTLRDTNTKSKNAALDLINARQWDVAKVFGELESDMPGNAGPPPEIVPGISYVYRETGSQYTLRTVGQAVCTSPDGTPFHRVIRGLPVYSMSAGTWTRTGDFWTSEDRKPVGTGFEETRLYPRSFLEEEYDCAILAGVLVRWPMVLVRVLHEYLYAREPNVIFINCSF